MLIIVNEISVNQTLKKLLYDCVALFGMLVPIIPVKIWHSSSDLHVNLLIFTIFNLHSNIQSYVMLFSLLPHAPFTLWLALDFSSGVGIFVCFIYAIPTRQNIAKTENSLHINFDFCVFLFLFHFSRIFRNKWKSVTIKTRRFYSKNYCLIRQSIPWNSTWTTKWTMIGLNSNEMFQGLLWITDKSSNGLAVMYEHI